MWPELILILVSVLEMLWALLTSPLRETKERPVVTCQDSPRNRRVVTFCNHMRSFAACPWAPTAKTQIFVSRLIPVPATPYRRENVALSDGVEVALDWKGDGLPPGAPLVVCCPGQGSGSNQKNVVRFTELCRRMGWRCVVYNRRGHCNMSLLPVHHPNHPRNGGAPIISHPIRGSSDGASFSTQPSFLSRRSRRGSSAGGDKAGAGSASGPIAEDREEVQQSPTAHTTRTSEGGSLTRRHVVRARPSSLVNGFDGGVADSGGAGGLRAKLAGPSFSAPSFSGPSRAGFSFLGSPRELDLADLRNPSRTLVGPQLSPYPYHNLRNGSQFNLGSPRHLLGRNSNPLQDRLSGASAGTGAGAGAGAGARAGPGSFPEKNEDLPEPVPGQPRGIKVFPKQADVEDFQEVVAHIQRQYPDAPKFLVGFSAGANLAVSYCGRAAAGSNPFRAAVSVSNMHHFVSAARYLSEAPVKDAIACGTLQQRLRERLPDVRRLAEDAGLELDWEAIMRTRSLREFESLLVVPAYGYSDVDEYYEDVSCWKDFKDVNIPLLTIANKDDPLVHARLAEFAMEAACANPNIVSVVTRRGGHVGWQHGWAAEPWALQLALQYIKAIMMEPSPDEEEEGDWPGRW